MMTLRNVPSILAFAVSAIVFLVVETRADGYRLGIGDVILLDHTGIEASLPLQIDADGEIRLAPIGGVSIAGLTLNAAETAIERSMSKEGLFVNPDVNLTIRDYAPVMVGGDVINPGRFEYVPGMTVAAALALSGGGQARGLTRTEIARVQAEISAGLLTAHLDIALAVVKLARFRAVLAGPEAALTLSAEEKARIPSPQTADLEQILRNEADALASERARAEKLLSFWENEIATIEAQARNFDARIALQQEIVASTLAGLEAAQELSDRGLQTAGRLATAEQRAADARSRVLELEGAKIAAAQAVSAAARERVVFLANEERTALVGIQETNRDLETATYRYQRFEEQRAALSGGPAGLLVDPDAVNLTFVLQSARADRPSGKGIALDTVILPGEVLIVSAVPVVDELDG